MFTISLYTDTHNALFWITYFNNDCAVYWSNKDDSKWFLKSAKRTFAALKRVKTLNLKEKQKQINEHLINKDHYNSDINILTTDKEDLMKIVNFEGSEEFIEKSNTEELFNFKEAWIQTYKKLLKTLSINKDTDYKKWVIKLKNQILYIIWDKYTQCQKLTEVLF